MLRSALLFVANHRAVRQAVTQHDLLGGLTQRYVAGEELADGIIVAQTLNTQRLQVTLDHLGESVTTEFEARRATLAYLDALEAIAREGVEAGISLKLTQLGLDVRRELCTAHLRSLLERTRALADAPGGPAKPLFVRIDMESSAYTQRTLDIHEQLWKEGYRNLGIVLQAYLHRAAADVERAIELEIPVRLCKGAYLEPPQVAFSQKAAVDANFARLMERLLRAGTRPAIATHDERLIRHAQDVARRERIPTSDFEFQMLFGVRRDLQLRLVRQGYRVRVYVPYGEQWYPYLVRRLAERPANLGFFVRSLVLEALAGRRNGARGRI
jgi:proline dehydrogenase